MRLIRTIVILLALIGLGYVGWVVALNLPGSGGSSGSTATDGARVRTAAVATAPSRLVGAGTGLLIPVAGIRPDQLTDTFDDARGSGRVHDAIDIIAPRGTPVIAASEGTVEKLFESKLGGRTIYIRRPGGEWIDYYAHLDSYADGLAEGQRIARGQVIGAVGSTGDASPEAPHLHYAINAMAPGEGWWKGQPVNPYPLLIGR